MAMMIFSSFTVYCIVGVRNGERRGGGMERGRMERGEEGGMERGEEGEWREGG